MKKLLLILLPVLLLIGGGGGAAYFFLVMQKEEETAEAPPPPPVEDPVFFDMKSLAIPVIRGGAVRKYILLKVTLEVADDNVLELAQLEEPRLIDLCLRELHGYFSQVPVDAKPSRQPIERRLLKASRRILGKNSVKAVLIQGIYEKTS